MAAGNGRRYCRRVFLPPNAPPTRRARLVLAWCVALVSATFVAFRFAGRPADTGDFDLAYTSARMLRAGLDPYLRIGPHAPVADAVGSRYLFPMAYPLPAVLIALPFSLLPLVAARAAFGALGGGLLAYALAARGRGAGLAVFLSAPYLHALGAVQWSPLLTAAALLPGVGFLLAAKPTTGAALFGARPTRATVLGGLAVAALSLAALPAWPLEWWHAARALTHLRAPVTVLPVGPLALLALLRWRRPEARLVALLACVPQTLAPYDLVPLFLVPRTRAEGLALAILTAPTIFAGTWLAPPDAAWDARLVAGAPLLVALGYLPCVIMVLRRPNADDVPAWGQQIAVSPGAPSPTGESAPG